MFHILNQSSAHLIERAAGITFVKKVRCLYKFTGSIFSIDKEHTILNTAVLGNENRQDSVLSQR